MEITFASASDVGRVQDIKESITHLQVLLRIMEKIALKR